MRRVLADTRVDYEGQSRNECIASEAHAASVNGSTGTQLANNQVELERPLVHNERTIRLSWKGNECVRPWLWVQRGVSQHRGVQGWVGAPGV